MRHTGTAAAMAADSAKNASRLAKASVSRVL
jgi:hypothetical protein